MQEEQTQFEFETNKLRLATLEGEPWFVVADICAILEHGNPTMAVRGLDAEDVQVVDFSALNFVEGSINQTLNPGQKISIVNESGLYTLLLRSHKPKAKPFRRWVTTEVLPSIRKTGKQELEAKEAQPPLTQGQVLVQMAVAYEAHERRLLEVERQAERQAEVSRVIEAKQKAIEQSCQDFAVLAYANMMGVKVTLSQSAKLGKQCASLSRERNLPIGKARDPRFGFVGTYVEDVLEEVFTDWQKSA